MEKEIGEVFMLKSLVIVRKSSKNNEVIAVISPPCHNNEFVDKINEYMNERANAIITTFKTECPEFKNAYYEKQYVSTYY